MKNKAPKTSGCSTGRGTRVKYSTAMDWDEWAKKRRIYPAKYSTGEDGQIIHSTGEEFDKRVKKYKRKEYKDNKPGGARHPGFMYKHYKKVDQSQSGDGKVISPKPLKKVIIDY